MKFISFILLPFLSHSQIDSTKLLKPNSFKSILNSGWISLDKSIDLNIHDLIQINRYEGVRGNISLKLNSFIHKDLSPYGYLGYGFKDRAFKYGIGARYTLHQSTLNLEYKNDILASGRGLDPNYSAMDHLNYYLNIWFYRDFYQSQQLNMSYHSQLNTHFKYKTSLQFANISTKFDYQFDQIELKNLKLLTPSIDILYTDSHRNMISLNYKYHLPINSSFSSFQTLNLEGNFQIKTKLGLSKLTLNSGMTIGKTPLLFLNEGLGSSNRNDQLYQTAGLGSYRFFETMEPSSFHSNHFLAVFYKQPIIYLSKNYSRQLSFIYKGLVGELLHANLHSVKLNQPNPIYHELGFELDNLIFKKIPIGIAGYYRLGAHISGSIENNLAFRFLISL